LLRIREAYDPDYADPYNIATTIRHCTFLRAST
jgi:hypothetical protein